MKIYVVARSAKTNRPGCMHITRDEFGSEAVCGYILEGASRNYTSEPLMSILCKTCDNIMSR